jgi:hypothetical protein
MVTIAQPAIAIGLTARIRFPDISSFTLVLFSYVLLTYVLKFSHSVYSVLKTKT